MTGPKIVVLGAGVSGLTTALLFAKHVEGSQVTILAKHMPGDLHGEYTSPWAGANFHPFGEEGSKEAAWEARTWKSLAELAENEPAAGIQFLKERSYYRKDDIGSGEEGFASKYWFKDIVPDFRVLPQSELPSGIQSGVECTSVCINIPIYLPWLASQCLTNGVIFKRQTISHISEAKSFHHSGKEADMIINCTGLLASRLGGVMDTTVIPIRGQTVIIRNNPGFMSSVAKDSPEQEELCYSMTRSSGTPPIFPFILPILIYVLNRANHVTGGGTVLGGCAQVGNWNTEPDLALANRIMERAVELNPALGNGEGIQGLEIITHAVGLRPHRKGGVRLENECIGGIIVVHNYGHGGSGYQVSYACAAEVVRLVERIITT